MSWGEKRKLLEGGQKIFADKLLLVQRAGVDSLEAHRADLGQALERLAGAGNFGNALADGGWVVGALASRLTDSLDSALGQNGLSRHVQDPELERGATDIWN
jgi:hypothetical protein